MAQNATSYNPNRYLLPHNHLHQPSPQQHQQSQQQSTGYFCGNQLQPLQNHHGPPQQQQPQPQQPSQQHNTALARQHQQQPPYMMGCFPQNPNGWAGIPLISTAPRRIRKNNFVTNTAIPGNSKPRILIPNNTTEYDENAMTRLAMHAHGAPLILAGRYRNRTQKRGEVKQQAVTPNSSAFLAKKSVDSTSVGAGQVIEETAGSLPKPGSALLDNSTTGSDENAPSIGNSQDTCLPRIIKPRKRRKKDRKPQNTTIVCLPEAKSFVSQKNNANPQDFSQVTVTHDMQLNASTSRLSLQNFDNSQLCHEETPPNDHTILPYSNRQDLSEVAFKLQSSPEEESAGSCCCRICDPSCRIWAFPLRRSCSDNTAELELQKNNRDVGVIGSNRSRIGSGGAGTEWRNGGKVDSNRSLFRNGSFSDSGDSGCDLLSGINFGDDPIFFNGSTNQISTSPIGDDRNFIDFPTAETLLTESINEISKKLMETVDLRSDIFSSDSSSVFSDSVLSDDMIFNLESLTRSCNNINSNGNLVINNNPSQSVTYPANSTTASNDLFSDLQHLQNQQNHHLINKSNNINLSNLNCNYLLNGISGDNSNNSTSNCNNVNINNNNNNNHNNFVMFHEKDRENEIFNCFDMVWSRNDHHNNHHGGFGGVGGIGIGNSNGSSNGIFGGTTRSVLPIEEQRIQLQTTG